MTFVTSRAALKAAPVTDLIYLHAGNDNGMFAPFPGIPNVSDPREAVYVISDTPGYYWKRLYDGPLSFAWFGANLHYTPTTDNSVAFLAAVHFAGVTGEPLYIPPGRYGFTQPIWLDVADYKYTGVKIVGAGRASSILDMRSCTVSPNAMIYCSGSGTQHNYYQTLEDFGIIGDIPGFVFQMGQDGFNDPVNMPVMSRISIQNFNATGASRGAKLNYICGGDFDIQVNCGSGGYVGGNGIALTMRQVAFSRIFGSIGSSETAIQMQDGFNIGNHLDTLDMENVKICWRIQSGTAWNNKATAGQWSFSHCGADHQTGLSNRIEVPNIAANAPATVANFVAASAGLTVVSKGLIPVTTPPQPWLQS